MGARQVLTHQGEGTSKVNEGKEEEQELLKQANTHLCQKASNPKRKRVQDIEAPLEPSPKDKNDKQAQISATGASIEENWNAGATSSTSEDDDNPILHWSRHGRWPKKYFDQDNHTSASLRTDPEAEGRFEEDMQPTMIRLLARKKLSLAQKRSNSSNLTSTPATASDQKPREMRSVPYARPSYTFVLAAMGSFLDRSERGITDTSKGICSDLLEREQTYPLDSLFRDDIFEKTCQKISDRNETMVIRDIALLIVPSAQTLATYGATHLKQLTEGVNEGWNNSIPFYGPRPQPDYSVGFGRSAFTDDQLEQLKPFVGDIADDCTSFFTATLLMYLPFLTCEVKCGAAGLDIADRQNAHSMTLAVRGVVELFRYVQRENEVNGEILAFSISHDNSEVRIYGHYAMIDGAKTTYHRHPIRQFSFTDLDGKEKWTTYRFTKNVYDIWMPMHLKRICSAIADFPRDVNFSMDGSGLSQELSAFRLEQPFTNSPSSQGLPDNQSGVVEPQNVTPGTSVNESGPFRRPEKRGRHATRTPSPDT